MHAIDPRLHPIDPAVRRDIEARLAALEAQHGVRILFACESGSRGWGFASTDSDYDVRFVYVQPPAWYLRIEPGRDVIEEPISALLDINGWELRKALRLLARGNTTLGEWLDSPVHYRADAAFITRLQAARAQVYRPQQAFHHYLHMARGNDRGYLHGTTVRLKKYLYVLRPLLAAQWVLRHAGPPPMRFAALVEALIEDPALRTAIDALLARKRQGGEALYGPPEPLIQTFIDTTLQALDGAQPPAHSVDSGVLDALLFDCVMQV
ncbi:nucleotidyltransferase domain-containing protein [Plasticicumulans acidivorans]|uniref:Nucleotidyltransferase n=1 Tax=Plasticicumulans acidivorans TaxID=886464 RepID=A0A317MYW5_9GAMM|nr:nucleotidyltransferase domain-containing protein [Plasticicumulans acidivorans]PWV64889.1 hypothetical protein C7443_102543 [Plasticicumulans acidivorans]